MKKVHKVSLKGCSKRKNVDILTKEDIRKAANETRQHDRRSDSQWVLLPLPRCLRRRMKATTPSALSTSTTWKSSRASPRRPRWKRRPVILQVSKGARAYAKHVYLVKLVEAALLDAQESGVDLPIVLHLDHGPDFETCKSLHRRRLHLRYDRRLSSGPLRRTSR